MRRAILAITGTIAGLAALLSFKSHAPSVPSAAAATGTGTGAGDGAPAPAASSSSSKGPGQGLGFTTGAQDSKDKSLFTVTTSDAHAWPEAWFAGTGWVRFEPTPPASGSTVPDYTVPAATSPSSKPNNPSSVPTTAPKLRPRG